MDDDDEDDGNTSGGDCHRLWVVCGSVADVDAVAAGGILKSSSTTIKESSFRGNAVRPDVDICRGCTDKVDRAGGTSVAPARNEVGSDRESENMTFVSRC